MFKRYLGLVGIALLACTVPTPQSSANKPTVEINPDTTQKVAQFEELVKKSREVKETLDELNHKL